MMRHNRLYLFTVFYCSILFPGLASGAMFGSLEDVLQLGASERLCQSSSGNLGANYHAQEFFRVIQDSVGRPVSLADLESIVPEFIREGGKLYFNDAGLNWTNGDIRFLFKVKYQADQTTLSHELSLSAKDLPDQTSLRALVPSPRRWSDNSANVSEKFQIKLFGNSPHPNLNLSLPERDILGPALTEIFGRDLPASELALSKLTTDDFQYNVVYDGLRYRLVVENFDVMTGAITFVISKLSQIDKPVAEIVTMAFMQQQSGLGTLVARDILLRLKALGITRVTCEAVGSPQGVNNGYYTWARWGFNGLIPELTLNLLPDSILSRLPAENPTVQDLIALPDGLEYWRKYGGSFSAVFDLSEGSESWRLLYAYLNEKGFPYSPSWSED